MVSIVKKIVKGRPYYYATRSGRVNGKPRIVWQKYLGTVEDIINRASGNINQPLEVDIYEAGGVAALLKIADDLKLVEIIDEIVPKRAQGASVGQYIVLAALNRALAPCSKLRMPDWYKNTILHRLWGHDPDLFSSERFWDHMDRIKASEVEQIQIRIAQNVKNRFKIDPKVVLYDTTNFITYIATGNARNTIAQRGRQKQKRNDLRQVGLALLTTQDFHIPLFHRTYEGNIPDRSLFAKVMPDLKKQYTESIGPLKEAVLVFDKGNISQDAMDQLIVSKQAFVCAIPKNTIFELFSTPIDKFRPAEGLSGTRVYSCQLEIWNTQLRAVLTYCESFYMSQLVDLTNQLQKCEKKLRELNQKYAEWNETAHKGRKLTSKDVESEVASIVGQGELKEIIHFEIKRAKGLFHVIYNVNQEKMDQILRTQLGRSLLVTSIDKGSDESIVGFYRGLSEIENGFKDMKNINYLHWHPQFHWTDDNLVVHTLYCVLALLMSTLAHKICVEGGVRVSLIEMIRELSSIRQVALIYPNASNGNKSTVSLSRMSPSQKRLAELLEISSVLDR